VGTIKGTRRNYDCRKGFGWKELSNFLRKVDVYVKDCKRTKSSGAEASSNQEKMFPGGGKKRKRIIVEEGI